MQHIVGDLRGLTIAAPLRVAAIILREVLRLVLGPIVVIVIEQKSGFRARLVKDSLLDHWLDFDFLIRLVHKVLFDVKGLEIVTAPLRLGDDEVADGCWLIAEFFKLKVHRKELLLLVSDGLG